MPNSVSMRRESRGTAAETRQAAIHLPFYSDLLAEQMFVCRECVNYIGQVAAACRAEGLFSPETVDRVLFFRGCIIYHS